MKLSKVKQLIEKLEECDDLLTIMYSSHRSPFETYSVGMKEALQGSVIERRNNLLDQMKRHGIEVEV